MTLPFNIATLLFLSVVLFLPQPFFKLGASAPSPSVSSSLDWFRIAESLPIGYFLPIDANSDDVISAKEMKVALSSVGQAPLSADEAAFLQERTGGQPLTWNRFINALLVT